MTTIETILIIFEVIVSLILTAMIPWAVVIERRLARIETSINENFKQRVEDNAKTLRYHSERIGRIEVTLGHRDKHKDNDDDD